MREKQVQAASVVVALLLAGTFLLLSIDAVRDPPYSREDAATLLCAWKDSMLAQIDADWLFLEQNPEGTEGISKESVAKDIEDKRLALDLITPHLPNCSEITEGRG